MANKNTTKYGTALFLLVLVGGCTITHAASGADRILLEDVGALVLKPGDMTSGRRAAPLSQLSCIGGVGCDGKYALDSVMCKNIGTDGNDVNWECTAEMPNDVKFGFTEINCEGYDSPDDQYVLVGSCQLRYNIKHRNGFGSDYHATRRSSGIEFAGLVMGGILLCAICSRSNGNGYGRHGYGRCYNGPGFWSGVATGAVAGNAWGGRRRWGGGRTRIWSRGRRTYRATGHARTSRR